MQYHSSGFNQQVPPDGCPHQMIGVQNGRVSTPGVTARVGLEAHERDMAAAAWQIATQQDTIVTLKSQLADQKAANAELSRRTLPRVQQASSTSPPHQCCYSAKLMPLSNPPYMQPDWLLTSIRLISTTLQHKPAIATLLDDPCQ